jgi:hypothetical protein
MGILAFVGAIMGALVVNIISEDLRDWCEKLSVSVHRHSLRNLRWPPEPELKKLARRLDDRYNNTPGKLSKLICAFANVLAVRYFFIRPKVARRYLALPESVVTAVEFAGIPLVFATIWSFFAVTVWWLGNALYATGANSQLSNWSFLWGGMLMWVLVLTIFFWKILRDCVSSRARRAAVKLALICAFGATLGAMSYGSYLPPPPQRADYNEADYAEAVGYALFYPS